MVEFGYFHLVGAILTPWVKIYPFEGKMRGATFSTGASMHFFGNSNMMIYFQVELQFPLK